MSDGDVSLWEDENVLDVDAGGGSNGNGHLGLVKMVHGVLCVCDYN